MPRLTLFLFSLFPFFVFSGCAGNNFDEATIPPEQVATEMSFKRMANHGGIEPVVEIDQAIEEWQFHIGAYTKVSVLGGAPTETYTLSDRSGIRYTVSSETTNSEMIDQLATGVYGYASGSIISVDRDYAAGKIAAVIELKQWRER
jgi:hypothetical protein